MLPLSFVDSEIDILMRLGVGLGNPYTYSAWVGASILSAFSVPSIRWAFESFRVEVLDDSVDASLLDECFRPGIGKENLEVRPIVSDSFKPPGVASKSEFLNGYANCTTRLLTAVEDLFRNRTQN